MGTSAVPRLMQHEREALDELAAALRARFGARLDALELFGSRVRGEGNEDSTSTSSSRSKG